MPLRRPATEAGACPAPRPRQDVGTTTARGRRGQRPHRRIRAAIDARLRVAPQARVRARRRADERGELLPVASTIRPASGSTRAPARFRTRAPRPPGSPRRDARPRRGAQDPTLIRRRGLEGRRRRRGSASWGRRSRSPRPCPRRGVEERQPPSRRSARRSTSRAYAVADWTGVAPSARNSASDARDGWSRTRAPEKSASETRGRRIPPDGGAARGPAPARSSPRLLEPGEHLRGERARHDALEQRVAGDQERHAEGPKLVDAEIVLGARADPAELELPLRTNAAVRASTSGAALPGRRDVTATFQLSAREPRDLGGEIADELRFRLPVGDARGQSSTSTGRAACLVRAAWAPPPQPATKTANDSTGRYAHCTRRADVETIESHLTPTLEACRRLRIVARHRIRVCRIGARHAIRASRGDVTIAIWRGRSPPGTDGCVGSLRLRPRSHTQSLRSSSPITGRRSRPTPAHSGERLDSSTLQQESDYSPPGSSRCTSRPGPLRRTHVGRGDLCGSGRTGKVGPGGRELVQEHRRSWRRRSSPAADVPHCPLVPRRQAADEIRAGRRDRCLRGLRHCRGRSRTRPRPFLDPTAGETVSATRSSSTPRRGPRRPSTTSGTAPPS